MLEEKDEEKNGKVRQIQRKIMNIMRVNDLEILPVIMVLIIFLVIARSRSCQITKYSK